MWKFTCRRRAHEHPRVLILMVVALLVIPLGLPGLWIMVGVLAIGAVYKAVGLLTIAAVVVIAGIAELLEFVFVKR